MKLRHAVKYVTDEARAPTDKPPAGQCEANRCPEFGTISPNTREGGPWYCRFHFMANPMSWPSITEERIRVRESETA